jgi:transcriptional regulator with XRE-family HTH domain
MDGMVAAVLAARAAHAVSAVRSLNAAVHRDSVFAINNWFCPMPVKKTGRIPSALLVQARQASGLSQRELARRARTSQSVVARIESGEASPSWRTIEHLLRCAGFEIQASLLAHAPSHMLDDVPRILALTAEERLTELRNADRLRVNARRLT